MSKDKLAQVFHFDLYGKREEKYEFLNENSLESIDFTSIPNKAPMFFMVEKDFGLEDVYNSGIDLIELFPLNNVGIVTSRDSFVIDKDYSSLTERITEFFLLSKSELFAKYQLKDNSSWKIDKVKLEEKQLKKEYITKVSYRPFDENYIYYNPNFIERARTEVMNHFTQKDNLGLVIGRQGQVVGSMPWNLCFVSKHLTDFNIYYRGGGNTFPLYLYPENNAQLSIGESQTRVPNLNMEIVDRIAEGLMMDFQPENASTPLSVTNRNNDPVSLSGVEDHYASQAPSPLEKAGDEAFSPIDILDYIYAVLHSPAYREKYKEFLKIDFPRVPYPTNARTFIDLVDLGRQLRELHLLESPEVENYITQYPVDGDNVVVKPVFTPHDLMPFEDNGDGTVTISNINPPYMMGKVYINDTQYFDNVPEVAWNFYIGGYQPAQKWLKDRKGRELGFEDILHYQKMIVALTRTGELMEEIDGVLEV